MNDKEKRLVAVADKYVGDITTAKKIQKLGEEMMELAMAVQEGEPKHIEEELGDCMYILLHIASRVNKKKSYLDYLFAAATKMIMRRNLNNPKGLHRQLKILGQNK
jgi:NTP pyrophosphatase (non-canonical NTP hydrolase)